MRFSRTTNRYQPDEAKDETVINALLELADKNPTYGFKMMYDKLRQDGKSWNHKRIYRVYRLLKLNLRRKCKKRLPNRNPQPLRVPQEVNQTWSIDFMSDALMSGRRFRTFNVIDDYNREALDIIVDISISSLRVIRVLDQIAQSRGFPERIRLDNGPEFISIALAEWAEANGVFLEFIKPGRPTQNSFIERFNRTFRTEVLDHYLFRSLNEVREITRNWMEEYNNERPHQSLNGMAPVPYLRQKHIGDSNLGWY